MHAVTVVGKVEKHCTTQDKKIYSVIEINNSRNHLNHRLLVEGDGFHVGSWVEITIKEKEGAKKEAKAAASNKS